MTTLSDQGLSALQNSKEFSPGPNHSLQGPNYGDQLGTKKLAIDELIRAMPFEAYDRDPLSAIYASRPATVEPNPAFLPGTTYSSWGVAEWFAPSMGIVEMRLELETTVDATYETFYMRRLGTVFELDPYQIKIASTRSAGASGPDPVPTLIRTASIAVLRSLSRDAINNTDPGDNLTDGEYRMCGLARFYDDGFGGTGADPQVFQAPTTLALGDVRQLMRQVAPSEDGFGMGPNALLMSRRTRDLLISLERAQGTSPTFLPDPHSGGELRYHLDGVPVYVGPVREDEDVSGSVPAYEDSGASPFLYKYSSIYAMRLGGQSGIRMLHFGGDSANFGLHVESVAPNTSSAALGYRVHGHYALYIPEHQSCARLWGIDISGEAA